MVDTTTYIKSLAGLRPLRHAARTPVAEPWQCPQLCRVTVTYIQGLLIKFKLSLLNTSKPGQAPSAIRSAL